MITELYIGGVTVDVVFKDIKNVHLSVYPPTGRVRISAPCRMSLESIRLFTISKLGWIKKQQIKQLSQDRETSREYLERESHYLWGQRYLLHISDNDEKIGVDIHHRRIILRVEANATSERKRAVLDDWYRAELRRAAKPFISNWEMQFGCQVRRLFIQRMKTKWGSSNPQSRTIRLNLELVKKPIECLDYVILHEIAHFLVPNHSGRFSQLLDEKMPSWNLVRQKLNEAPLAEFR